MIMTDEIKETLKGVAGPLTNEDVFAFWKRELDSRKRLRRLVGERVHLGVVPQRDGLDFLFRTLSLTENRSLLFRVLWEHPDRMAVIRWLGDRGEGFRSRFVQELAENWFDERSRSRLDLLINMYTPALNEAYLMLLGRLDSKDMEHLVSRTANPELRRLVRREKEKMESRGRQFRLGVGVNDVREPGLDSIFGNKAELAKAVLIDLEQADVALYHHPYRAQRFLALCETCQKLFQMGWVTESLIMIVETYRDFMERGRLGGREALRVYRRLDRLARAVVPVYCLIEFEGKLRKEAENIYRSCLSQLVLEESSLAYLELYERFEEAKNTPFVYPKSEIQRFCLKLAKTRPDDAVLQYLKVTDRDEVSAEGCIRAANERIKSRPHEAFVIMEFLRLFVVPGLAAGQRRPVSSELLARYLDLWYWVPASRFMNGEIADSLSAGATGQTGREVHEVLRWSRAFAGKENQSHPGTKELAKRQGKRAALQAFFGTVLGVGKR